MKLNKKGFTLIELLGVITIIALLMIIVVPSVLKHLDQGKTSNYTILKKNMEIAAENYVSECSYSGNLFKVITLENDEMVANLYNKYKEEYGNDSWDKYTIESLCEANGFAYCHDPNERDGVEYCGEDIKKTGITYCNDTISGNNIKVYCEKQYEEGKAPSECNMFSSGKQVLIPFKCERITDEITLTALELAHNGFLNTVVLEDGNRKIIRSTDEKDVSTCLKITIKYDANKYKYTYQVDDSLCDDETLK